LIHIFGEKNNPMKQSYLLLVFTFLFGMFFTQQTSAQCTEDNLGQNESNSVGGHFVVGQSFTASCAGDIISVTVYYNNAPGDVANDRILNIRDGALNTSPIIHTEVIPGNTIVPGPNVFTISASVGINSAEQNYFEITEVVASGNSGSGISFNSAGAYANGSAWFSGSNLGSYDLTFAVQIAAPCPPTTGTDTQVACDSLVWIDGATYYSSNTTAMHTIVGGAASGCDSIVSLDLTIINSAVGTDTQVACDSLVWIDATTYYSSNTTAVHTIVGGAASGCDSIVTLDLTINTSAIGTDSQTACISFDWIDGQTYTASNTTATFNIAGGAANGCDSLVTLDLTINTINISVVQSGATFTSSATGALYQWLDCAAGYSVIAGETNQVFVASSDGTYAVELTENGCTDTSACNTYSTVGINENDFNLDVDVYPNPNAGSFQVDINGAKSSRVIIQIYSVTGALVYKETIETSSGTHSEQIDLGQLGEGVYMLKLNSEDLSSIVRIVITK
jgi:hypothetical protein